MWMPHVLLIHCPTQIHKAVIIIPGLPWWFSRKESAYNAGDLGSIPGLGQSPGEGNGNPLRQRSLVGYRPWGGENAEHDLLTKQPSSLPVFIQATYKNVEDYRW